VIELIHHFILCSRNLPYSSFPNDLKLRLHVKDPFLQA
jgi:hypothetical protein